MTEGFGYAVCPNHHGFRYRIGAIAAFCPVCRAGVKINPRARPVQYGSKFLRQPPILRPPERIDPGPMRNPRPAPYRPPQTPPARRTPAQVGRLEGPPPVLSGADPPPAAAAAPAAATTSAITVVFWIVVVIVLFVGAGAAVMNPDLVGEAVEAVQSALGEAASGVDRCAQVRRDVVSISNCSSGTYGVTKPGYSWCDVQMRDKGPDWNLNGTNMSDTGFGQGWIPNECIP